MSEKDNVQKEPQKVAPKKGAAKKPSLLKGMFSGTLLTSSFVQKQRWYLLLLFCMAVAYISYRYNIEKTINKSRKLEQEIKILQAEYVSHSEELMRQSKRSEVLKQIQQRCPNLIESRTPPMRISAD